LGLGWGWGWGEGEGEGEGGGYRRVVELPHREVDGSRAEGSRGRLELAAQLTHGQRRIAIELEPARR